MKDQIKKAVESAEQEIQEREIARLKSIVSGLLQKKSNLENEKRKIEEEISIIKQTIDDFKAGRLDKVKEMQEKNPIAHATLPFGISIINQPFASKPWGWNYQITSTGFDPFSLMGNTTATFTSGTYCVNGKIINL